MVITAETPVRDIVVEVPSAIPVFEQFGIDYCCGGKHTLAEACIKRDQSLAPVIDEIKRRELDTAAAETQWQTAPLGALVQHIVQKHHAFTREQLTLIEQLAAKVE